MSPLGYRRSHRLTKPALITGAATQSSHHFRGRTRPVVVPPVNVGMGDHPGLKATPHHFRHLKASFAPISP
jgi:hypothetical protein